MQNQFVGMSEIKVTVGSGQLTCLGLGSCIGLLAIDPFSGICGMVHIMLPEPAPDRDVPKPGKYATTGIPALLEEVESKGAKKSQLIFVMAGGAQIFNYGAQNGASKMDIGKRNGEQVESELKKRGFKVSAKDIGGSNGRTLIVNVETGEIKTKTAAGGERVLHQVPTMSLRAA